MSGAERRSAILDAAHREFSRSGYHGASTARIATAAGCSEPMLYKHFAGKQALFTAVLEATSRPIEDRFDELFDAPGDIMHNWNAAIPLIYADPAYAETMRLRMLALAAIDDPQVRETLTEINERLRARVRVAIERGQREGTVDPSIDPDYVLWLWVGMQFSSCYREALGTGEFADMLPEVQRFIGSLAAGPDHLR